VRESTLRFLFTALMIVSTAILLCARSGSEIFPPRQELQSFPTRLGAWSGTDLEIDDETRQVLGPGDFLLRRYDVADSSQNPINLFIAYFPSQRTGDTIHSPQNCLPGSGWTPVESKRIMLSVPSHSPFPANRYVIQKGKVRQLVLYWYWAHDRGVASEYMAKYYLIADSIKLRRSDGSLVRIVTPFDPGETFDAAEQRLMPFVEQVVGRLSTYIPR
jgi:EpsI family protein